MQKPIEKIFVELIQKSLNLPSNYGKDKDGNIIPCVVIASQNIKLFNTSHIQITIKTVSNNVFACRKEYFEITEKDPITNNDVTKYYERQMLNDKRLMQIDIYSKNNEARDRFWEVQSALGSTLAEQLSDEYQFRISKISNSFNNSGLDGGSDINRFTIRFDCLSWYEKVNEIDYYDTFPLTAQATSSNVFANFTIKNNLIINN